MRWQRKSYTKAFLLTYISVSYILTLYQHVLTTHVVDGHNNCSVGKRVKILSPIFTWGVHYLRVNRYRILTVLGNPTI